MFRRPYVAVHSQRNTLSVLQWYLNYIPGFVNKSSMSVVIGIVVKKKKKNQIKSIK